MSRPLACVAIALALGCGGADPDAFPGLGADVDIVIDDMGVPHIYGASDTDVFFAAGYQMATDRLFQMDLMRRRAHGRWCELFGVDAFEDDRIARLFRWRDLGRANAEHMRAASPETWSVLVAWVAGVNRRIAEVTAGEAELPWGFGADALDYAPERWEDADPLIIGRMIGFANDNRIEQELFATLLHRLEPEVAASIELLQPMYPVFILPEAERPVTGAGPLPPRPPAPAATADHVDAAARLRRIHRAFGSLRVLGSNNWAVAGAHTDSGRPLIANDPHQALESPSLMYALHLSSADGGGTLDVAGFAFAATPGVQLGHNRNLVWTATTNFADTMDVWEVDYLDDAVRIAGEVVPVDVREEVLAVREPGQPAGQGSELRLFFSDVPGRGVLLPADLAPLPIAAAGRTLLLDWTGFDTGLTRELLVFNRAATLDEFDGAVDMLGAGFNFVAADAGGISYRVGHVVPDRGDPAGAQAPWLVMEGEDAASYWTGAVLPPERLPHSRDPARGFLASANNDPFGFTANGRVDDDPWYYGAFFEPGFRARRIDDELTRLIDRGEVGAADLQALQLDTHSVLADDLLPLLFAAHARVAIDEALAEFRGDAGLDALAALLAGWDRRMARDSAAALVFHAWLHSLAEEVLADDIGVFFGPAMELASVTVLKVTAMTVLGAYPRGDDLMPQGRDWLLVRALAATAAWLDERFGGVDPAGYRFGDVHGTRFVNRQPGALDLPFTPSDGGEDTINVGPCTTFAGRDLAERWESRFGPIFRMVGGFAEDGTPEIQVSWAPGQSADPDSPHFDDGVADWIEGRYRPLRFRRADVEAAEVRRIVLPAGLR